MASSSPSKPSRHIYADLTLPSNQPALSPQITGASHTKVSHFRIIFSQSLVTSEILHHTYPGSGTPEDPYRIEFIPHDPRNPKTWKKWKKWLLTVTCAVATLGVTFVSSAFTGGITEMMEAFGVGTEVITLGVSLFVLGFAIGPLLWGPLSELYGRQILYFATFAGLTAFNAGMYCTFQTKGSLHNQIFDLEVGRWTLIFNRGSSPPSDFFEGGQGTNLWSEKYSMSNSSLACYLPRTIFMKCSMV